MKPASAEELLEVRTDFVRFLQLGNSDLKSAYLAASGRGFSNLLKSNRAAVLLERDEDHKYIICSYPEKPDSEVALKIANERIIRFHTDSTVFI